MLFLSTKTKSFFSNNLSKKDSFCFWYLLHFSSWHSFSLLFQFPFPSSAVMHRTSSHQPVTAICTGCSFQFALPPIAILGSSETCCVCQSSTNFGGRKLITGNGSVLLRVTMKKRERLLFLLLPIAQEQLPSRGRRAVILPTDTSVPLLLTTPKDLFNTLAIKLQQLISGVCLSGPFWKLVLDSDDCLSSSY